MLTSLHFVFQVTEEGTMSLMHRLCGHRNPISYVAWSPNDKMVLTCGNAEVLKLWDVESGTCKHTFGNESIIVNSCAWYPDSERLVCGSSEPENCIYTWDLEGQILDAWKGGRMPKVSDLSVTPDGEYLISICSDRDIRVFNFRTKSERVISEEYPITSLSVSRDGKFFIINLNSQEIHMWDIEGKWETPLKYAGHKQGKYVIRSCFGGSDCAFIASGSENSQVRLQLEYHIKSLHINEEQCIWQKNLLCYHSYQSFLITCVVVVLCNECTVVIYDCRYSLNVIFY